MDQPHACDTQEKKTGVPTYSHAGPHPSFLQAAHRSVCGYSFEVHVVCREQCMRVTT